MGLKKYRKKPTKQQYYTVYSMLFAAVAILMFGSYFWNGKSFIWDNDGWKQHYQSLAYYARWLRTIVRTLLFEHRLEIPTYSFSIGYGSDILSTLHYYVIGDPLCLLSVFVPTKYMSYFYSALVLLRFYLSGITFSMYCFYVGQKMEWKGKAGGFGKCAVLAGAFVYAFCGFAIYAGVRHPYFLNPMVYFPLVLLGAEKILDRKKPFLFVMAVFISAASNFYFFYMIAVLTVLYVAWRLCVIYKKDEIKQAFLMIGKFAGYAILGTCMSMPILLPTVIGFFQSSRMESGYTYDLLYSVSDYEGNIGAFLSIITSNREWTVMGYAAIALVAVIVLFLQEEHKDLKIAFLVLTGMLLLPTVGSIMNGFSYVSNRWIWGYSFLLAFIVVVKWEDLFSLAAKEKAALLGCLGLYLLLCMMLPKSRHIETFFAMAMAFFAFGIFCAMPQQPHGMQQGQIFLVFCILANIVGNAFFKFSVNEGNYVKDFIAYDEVESRLNRTEAAAIHTVLGNREDFFRYSGSGTTTNATCGLLCTGRQCAIWFFFFRFRRQLFRHFRLSKK